MQMMANPMLEQGYNGSGIIPQRPQTQVQPATQVPAPQATNPPPVTTPATPSTPVQATNYMATQDNPLAPLNNYQPQSYQPNFQAQNYTAPQLQQPNYNAQTAQAPQIGVNYASQSLSAPQINPGSYQSGSTGAPTVGAQNASAGQFDVNAFRPFADAVYSEATRQLDPQFQAQEASFRQRMVNQGIQEGTPAFDAAYANFERSRNDAYGSARNQALAQALGAQNQFFGQNLANSQMGLQASLANASNALQAAGLNQADRQFGANFGLQGQLANADNAYRFAGLNQADRQFGANLGMQGQLANASNYLQAFGLGQADRQFGANLSQQGGLANMQAAMQAMQMGQNDRQFGAQNQYGYDQMNQNDRQFGANMDYTQGRADMQDLMALLGYGQQTDMYNNQLLGLDQNRAMALFGLIPGLTPTQIDVTGPMNSYMQAQQAAYNRQGQAANGLFGALGQLGAAGIGLLSDIRAKTDISRVGTLDNGLPVYLYRYKHGGPMHIGLMAQDVEKVNPSAVVEIGGIKHVHYSEAVR